MPVYLTGYITRTDVGVSHAQSIDCNSMFATSALGHFKSPGEMDECIIVMRSMLSSTFVDIPKPERTDRSHGLPALSLSSADNEMTEFKPI